MINFMIIQELSVTSCTLPLQPAEPLSTIASTSATSKNEQSYWISLKTLSKNQSNSIITVVSISSSITTTKDKVI